MSFFLIIHIYCISHFVYFKINRFANIFFFAKNKRKKINDDSLPDENE